MSGHTEINLDAINTEDRFFILLFSVRYALGRRSSAVSIVCDSLLALESSLTTVQKKMIAQEINAHSPNLGDTCDAERWLDAFERFDK